MKTAWRRPSQRYRWGVHPLLVLGPLALCGGCVIGGRLTGGVTTGAHGTTGMAGATFQIGVVDRRLSRLTIEAGSTMADPEPRRHAGLRYDAGHDGHATWTASAGAEYGDAGGFAQLTAGLALQAALLEEKPDVLSGALTSVAIEGVAMVGGRDTADVGLDVGAQISLELLWFALMR